MNSKSYLSLFGLAFCFTALYIAFTPKQSSGRGCKTTLYIGEAREDVMRNIQLPFTSIQLDNGIERNFFGMKQGETLLQQGAPELDFKDGKLVGGRNLWSDVYVISSNPVKVVVRHYGK